MSKKPLKKLFVVRKYIWADSAQRAITLDRKMPVDDVWVDDEWKKTSNQPKDAIGFYVDHGEEE